MSVVGAPLANGTALPAFGRRAFLLGSAAAAAGLVLPSTGTARAETPLADVRPRSDWGADLPVRGELSVEAPEDVRFLLLHHSASSNKYSQADVPGILGSFYHWHTDPEHPSGGWPDIAYNFLIDKFGTVWEGREGSLERPVKGDATGGSQGFALLCCFVGDHNSEAPTPEATDAMVGLCAALALRYGIDPSPGARTRFTSRGSNRHPAGTEVETATVAGHRDMSQTTCPGDAAYRLVTGELPGRIAAARDRLAEATDPDPEDSDDDSASDDPPADDSPEDSDPQASEPTEEPEPAEPAPAATPGNERPSGAAGTQTPGSVPDSPVARAEPTPDTAVSLDGGNADGEATGSLRDSLGLRELTVLGVAAAAAAGGTTAAVRARDRE